MSVEIDNGTREEISKRSLHLRGVQDARSVELVEPSWRHLRCRAASMIIRVTRSRRDLFVAKVFAF